MNIKILQEELGYTPVFQPDDSAEIESGFTSDLLSDVMANASEQSILITIQAHKNSVAVASLAGIAVILICSGRSIPEDMLAAAREHDIAIYTTGDNQFTATAKVARKLEENG